MFDPQAPRRLRKAVLFASAALCLASPAAAQDLSAIQARMEALEARLQAQAAQIQAQADEIAALKAGQAGAPVVTAPEPPRRGRPGRGPAAQPVQQNIADTSAVPAPPERPAVLSLPNGRPSFVSADGRFDASLYTIVQVDAGSYLQKRPGPLAVDFRRDALGGTDHARDLNSGASLRRARLGLEGRLFSDFAYNFTVELSGEEGARLNQGWVMYTGFAPLRIRVGAFGPNDELEGVTPKTAMGMLEAAAVSDTVRPLLGGDGRFSAQLFGFGRRWFASAALTSGSVSSAGDYYDDQTGAVGRLAGRPLMWKDGFLHLGASLAYSLQVADNVGPDGTGPRTVQFRARPEVRLDNTRLIGTGPIPAEHAYITGLEMALEHKNLSMQAEALRFGVQRPAGPLPDPHFFGWYVSGSWMLTGEQRRYNLGNASIAEPTIRRRFDPGSGDWGALELAAKYSVIDLDYRPGEAGAPTPAGGVRGGEQHTLGASFNWYLNPSVRFMFGLQDVHILRLSPDSATFATPAGAEIGQRFQVVTMRSQLAF